MCAQQLVPFYGFAVLLFVWLVFITLYLGILYRDVTVPSNIPSKYENQKYKKRMENLMKITVLTQKKR